MLLESEPFSKLFLNCAESRAGFLSNRRKWMPLLYSHSPSFFPLRMDSGWVYTVAVSEPVWDGRDSVPHWWYFPVSVFPSRTESCNSRAHKLLIAFQQAIHELFSIQEDLLNNIHIISIEMGSILPQLPMFSHGSSKENSILRTHEEAWFISFHKLQKIRLSLWG